LAADDSYLLANVTESSKLVSLTALVDTFIDSCFADTLLPKEVKDKASQLELDELPDLFVDEAQTIAQYHTRFMVAVGSGVFLAALSLLAALIYCIAQCCCRSNNGRKKNVNKACTAVFGFGLLLGWTLAFFGAVSMFLGGSAVIDGIESVPKLVDDIGHDGKLYMDTTVESISNLMNTKFHQTVEKLEDKLDDAVDNIRGLIDELKTDSDYENLKDGLEKYTETLKGISKVRDSIEKLKGELVKAKDECDTNSLCPQDVEDQLNAIQLPKFPEMNTEDIFDQVEAIDNQLNKITEQFDSTFKTEFKAEIEKIENQFHNGSQDISDKMNEFQCSIADLQISQEAGEAIDSYSGLFKAGVYVMGALVLIFLSIVMVAAIVICCSNSDSGLTSCISSVSTLNTFLFLVTGVFLFLATTVLFLLGALTTEIVCKTIQEPRKSDVLELAFDLVVQQLEEEYGHKIDMNLEDFISQLENGTSIYILLKLENLYDLDKVASDWEEDFDITSTIEGIKDEIIKVINDIVDENSEIEEKIKNIENSIKGLDSKIKDALELKPIGEGYSLPFLNTLNEGIQDLQLQIKSVFEPYFDETGACAFEGKTEKLLDGILDIFEYMKNAGKNKINNFLDEETDGLVQVVQDYLDDALDQVKNHLGSVTPLWDIRNAVNIGLCQKIVDPYNIVWAGLGGALIMMLGPVLIFLSVLRARMQKKRPTKKKGRKKQVHKERNKL